MKRSRDIVNQQDKNKSVCKVIEMQLITSRSKQIDDQCISSQVVNIN